jgi:hypothetical protein
MRRLIGYVLCCWLVLAAIVGTALIVGRRQSLPSRLEMLHLTECVPPCWIGIVPGQTTIAEARQRIEQVFSYDAGYDLRVDPIDPNFWQVYIYRRAQLQAPVVITLTAHQHTIVDAINFLFSASSSEGSTDVPTLADLHSVLGAPSRLLLWEGMKYPRIAYGDNHSGVLINARDSDYSYWTDNVFYMVLYGGDEKMVYNKEGPWRGFRAWRK